jgi:chemotaxis signal transduction protein
MGITSLRGKIIPVLDLKRKLQLAGESVMEKATRLIVLRGSTGSIAAWVDRITGVLRLPVDSLQEPPGNLSDEQARFIEAVVLAEGRFISVVKAGELLQITSEAKAQGVGHER